MNDHQELILLVLEASEKLPSPRRARILRALAQIVGNESESTQLTRLAADLDTVESNFRQFKFNFIQEKA